ncbi:MAG: GNAT family N-acetyltransferase [Ahrensia sp.]|nr:GNAT family N-acetyltransferase [Ahrensia sp.]
MMFGSKAPEFVVLQAQRSDVDRIAALHGENFARGWSGHEIETMLDRPEATVLVIRRVGAPNEPICGFNIYQQSLEEAEILSIAVDTEYRRLGFADRLVRFAISALQGDRVKALFLEVDAKNHAAIGLYDRLGFRKVGERPAYYQGGDEGEAANALVMRLTLD